MKKTILIIDDDDFCAITLQKILGDTFNFLHETNPVTGLTVVTEKLPDIILLDVEMPGMTGYEVCKKLKENPATKNIPVMFLSAHNEVEDRLKGYDVGGDEYMHKPIIPAELTHKIAVLIKHRRHNEQLAESLASANKVAMMAMQSLGDTSMIINFMREITQNPSYIQIAETAINILSANDLETSIQLRTNNGNISRNNHGFCSPLEESMLGTLANCGRIVDLSKRSAFSFERVTIVVHNMPKNDPENYGRIKDLVAILVEVIDLEIVSIDMLLDAISRSDTLLNLLRRNMTTFRDIENRYRRQREASENILDKLVGSLADSFMFLGLTESQERYIEGLANEAVKNTQALFDDPTLFVDAYETDAVMKSLVNGLDSSMQQEVQGAVDASNETASRIELF